MITPAGHEGDVGMEMILSTGLVSASAFSTMVGYVAQCSNVCAKIIDTQGKITAINRDGLELLDAEGQDICGAIWADLWTGDMRSAASDAVDEAFAGRATTFAGDFMQGALRSTWSVDVFPLEWVDGKVASILAISKRLSDPTLKTVTNPQTEFFDQMSETLHAMSNLASVSASSARLLGRGLDQDSIAEIAQGLADASRRATELTESLKARMERVSEASPQN